MNHPQSEAMKNAHPVKAPDLTPPVVNVNGQKKEAKAAKEKANKEPKAPKEPRVPKDSNFKRVYPDAAKISVLTEGGKNPKRPGSAAHERFAAYGTGTTVSEALKAGATYADLSWDVGHGFIKVEIPSA